MVIYYKSSPLLGPPRSHVQLLLAQSEVVSSLKLLQLFNVSFRFAQPTKLTQIGSKVVRKKRRLK